MSPSPGRLVALTPIDRAFGLLLSSLVRPGETLSVREVDYGRQMELRLGLDDPGHGRREAVLGLHLDLLMRTAVRDVLMCAVERLRAYLGEQPLNTTYRLPSLPEDYDPWRGERLTARWLDETPPPPTVPPDTAKILVEFAKASKREEFNWLARSAGVKPEQLEELWRGTLARLGP